MNNVKCKNCGSFKIINQSFRVDPNRGRVTAQEGCMFGVMPVIGMWLAGILVSALVCIGLTNTISGQDLGMGWWLFTLAIGGMLFFYYTQRQKYLRLPIGYDHQCDSCGYKWVTTPGRKSANKNQ